MVINYMTNYMVNGSMIRNEINCGFCGAEKARIASMYFADITIAYLVVCNECGKSMLFSKDEMMEIQKMAEKELNDRQNKN